MGRTKVRWTEGRPLRILLIDSDLEILGTLRDMLCAQGHSVFIAVDPETAVLLAKQHTPHMIYAGIELEGTSGYALARELRALPQTSQSVMIALTHSNDDMDATHRANAGFDDFLLRPLNFDDILHLINSAANE